jgi:hypothetical protein
MVLNAVAEEVTCSGKDLDKGIESKWDIESDGRYPYSRDQQ